MHSKTMLVLIVSGSTLLGIMGNLLFRSADGSMFSWGVNIFLWMAALCATLLYTANYSGNKMNRESMMLIGPCLFFASTFMWRDNDFLRFWNGALMFVTASLIVTRSFGPWRAATAGYTEYLRLLAIAAKQTAVGPLLLATRDFRDQASEQAPDALQPPSRIKAAWPILFRGMLLSVVPIFIFGALFVSADPVFATEIQSLLNWDFETVLSNIGFALLFFAIAAGILRSALVQEPPKDQPDYREFRPFPIKAADVCVALALIDILFAAFVLVQFRFLFGGAEVISSVAGLNYASYARGGFFELAWVAGLALPVLLFAHWVSSVEPIAAQRRVKLLTGMLVALLFVIVASAFKRMWMYEDAWGMTERRLFVSVFIGVITSIFVWFLATSWRGKPKYFAFGVLIASMLTIGVLDLINPDRIVVQMDVARGKLICFDAQYLTELGADATPVLIASMSAVAPSEQPTLAKNLVDSYSYPKPPPFQEWNSSLASAHSAVKFHRAQLDALAAKAPQCRTD